MHARRCGLLGLAALLTACTGEPPPPPPPPPAPAAEVAVHGANEAAKAPSAPEEEISPELVAYPAPALERIVIKRRGAQVDLVVHFEACTGAASYDVQLARSVTFAGLEREQSVARSPARLQHITAGVWFVRVRARGPLGEGPYGTARLVDALGGITAQRRRKLGAERVLDAQADVTNGGAPSGTANAKPLRLVWERPASHAIVSTRTIALEGAATPGALVRLGDGPPVTASGVFRLQASLSPGKNVLVVTAELEGRRESVTRTLYFADPARLSPVKARFEKLRADLDEVAALRGELDRTAQELQRRLRDSSSAPSDLAQRTRGVNAASSAEQLRAELEKLDAARKELDAEIARALSELERLM